MIKNKWIWIVLIVLALIRPAQLSGEWFDGESIQSKDFWEVPLRFWLSDGTPVDTSATVLAYPVISDTTNHSLEPSSKFRSIVKVGAELDTFGVFVWANVETTWVYQFTVDGTLQTYPKYLPMGNVKTLIDSSAYATTVFADDVIPAHALGDSIVLSKNILTEEIKTKNLADNAATAPKIAISAINNVNKATSNLWNASAIDETDDYTWAGKNTFSDTIFVSGTAAKEVFELYKHPNATQSTTTGQPALEFWDVTPGNNAYGYAALVDGGAASRIMTPWFTDGCVFERLWKVPGRVDADSTVYFTFEYALANVAVGDSVSWVLEWLSYTLSETGSPGVELEATLATVSMYDPTPFVVGHATYYDYTIATQSDGHLDVGIAPGEYFDFRATVALGDGDNPICLIGVYATASITRTHPRD